MVIAGVGVAIAIKSALQQFNINGKVILLGTPGSFFLYPLYQRLNLSDFFS